MPLTTNLPLDARLSTTPSVRGPKFSSRSNSRASVGELSRWRRTKAQPFPTQHDNLCSPRPQEPPALRPSRPPPVRLKTAMTEFGAATPNDPCRGGRSGAPPRRHATPALPTALRASGGGLLDSACNCSDRLRAMLLPSSACKGALIGEGALTNVADCGSSWGQNARMAFEGLAENERPLLAWDDPRGRCTTFWPEAASQSSRSESSIDPTGTTWRRGAAIEVPITPGRAPLNRLRTVIVLPHSVRRVRGVQRSQQTGRSCKSEP